MIHARLCILASRFNAALVEQLVVGAQARITEEGINVPAVHWVEGALELPVLATNIVKRDKADALVALGVVVRGETPHFDYVCQGVTQGLMSVSTNFGIPIGSGVVMANTWEQAQARASLDWCSQAADHNKLQQQSNKGYEAAAAAIEVLKVIRQLEQQ